MESQRNINETGVIYRCPLDVSVPCYPYNLETRGNIIAEANDYTYDSEKRDYQWLGGSMDGGTRDEDKLLVCAPRFIAPDKSDYLMHGICYWIENTLDEQPVNVRRISPLRGRQQQIKDKIIDTNSISRYYYYILAEQGLSAHITNNSEEIIIGAPGIHTWKGSVIRYRQKVEVQDPSLSKRDTNAKRVPRQAEYSSKTYTSDIPNPDRWNQSNDSYLGYAVSSGYFDSADPQKLMFVATAPQADVQSGEAYIFDFVGESIVKRYILRGTQFGEYFGYAVLAEDLNADGLTDVIVSAPQYSSTGFDDDGAIYIFTNLGRVSFKI